MTDAKTQVIAYLNRKIVDNRTWDDLPNTTEAGHKRLAIELCLLSEMLEEVGDGALDVCEE